MDAESRHGALNDVYSMSCSSPQLAIVPSRVSELLYKFHVQPCLGNPSVLALALVKKLQASELQIASFHTLSVATQFC